MRSDSDETFGEDYLYFSANRFSDEQNEQDTDDVVRLLGLRAGDRVLDAPCGNGRISNRLAQRALHVVGVDASEPSLAEARAAGAVVDYRQGDLRDLPVDGPFDAAFSWFTSFGYFDDDGNRQVLREYHRVLRRDGRLLIDMHNRDGLIRQFTPAPFSYAVEIGDDVRIETSVFDCVEGRMETDRLIVRDGRVRRSHLSVRVPTITELRAWLADAGFSDVQFSVGDGSPPSIDLPRLVVVAAA